MQWRVSLAGFDSAEDIGRSPTFTFKLVRAGTAPPGMVRIVSSTEPFQLFIPGLDHSPRVDIPDFWIDRHEVTNREFKRFLDDGGYRRRELWQEPFVKGQQAVAFEASIALFVDTTGKPGPATWEQGAFPAGQDDFPVTGVSWYEAAAYARWAGKSLPTLYHWSRAADPRLSGEVVPAGNFGGKSLLPVTQAGGLTRGGAAGMPGNAKEWCLNPSGPNRFILGGAWNEPVYMFTDADAQSPFARAATYGFRLMKTDRPEDLSAALTGEAALPSRDLRKVPLVSDEVFRAWQSLYSFDHGSLDVKVDSVDDSSAEWRVESVSFAAAYGGGRVPAILFLPKPTPPPYQAVVYFPGSGTISRREPPTANEIEVVNYRSAAAARSSIRSTRARTARGRHPQRLPEQDGRVARPRGYVVERRGPGDRLSALAARHRQGKDWVPRQQLGLRHGPALPRPRAAAVAGAAQRGRLLPAGGAARSRSRQLRLACEDAGAHAQRTLRLLLSDRDVTGTDVRTARHARRTQAAHRL
jgi:hypothetical protein